MKTLGTLLCAVALVPTVWADDLGSHVKALNSRVQKALMKKDVASFEKILRPLVTPDFKHVENGQSMSFDQMVASMKQGMAMLQTINKAETQVISVKVKGNTGTVTVKHTMLGTTPKQEGKSSKLGFTGVSTDTYVKKNGKWLMSKMVWGKQQMTVDGKPFDPSKASGAAGK